MKTDYSGYCVWDADLGAFIPETFGIFINDKQYIKAVVDGMLRSDKDAVANKLESYRFYRVADFIVDKLPSVSEELTDNVKTLYSELLKLKER